MTGYRDLGGEGATGGGSMVDDGWPTAAAGAIRSVRRQRRRWLASGLIAYGILGLTLLVVNLAVSMGPLGSLGAIAGQRGEVVSWLDTLDQGFDHVAVGFTDAGASLASAASSARNAASLSQDLSTSMGALRDASRLSILGSRPLGSATEALGGVSARASGGWHCGQLPHPSRVVAEISRGTTCGAQPCVPLRRIRATRLAGGRQDDCRVTATLRRHRPFQLPREAWP